MNINEISKPVKQFLPEFNKYFKSLLQTDVALLNLIIKYMTQKTGKQVRPLIVLLSAEACGGINQRAFVAGAMVELLHTATLIHDDVVDAAKERRGIASINATWNNKIAILVGDFLLSKGLLTSVDSSEFDFLKVTSDAVKRISEGELLSIEKSRTLRVSEEDYFNITSGKTASLISACAEMGAIAANQTKEVRKALAEYGELVGIAFQIRDDIFDYTSSSFAIGKPVGNDLKEKKITLPLIYSLNNCSKDERKEIIKIIKNGNLRKKHIKDIIEFAQKRGGIDFASKMAIEYSEKAVDKLSILPDSGAKESLKAFARFVVERES